MKWKYSLTTNTIWTSFDGGIVEADTQEDALRLAEEELTTELELINSVLRAKPVTSNALISMDMDQIEVEPIVNVVKAKLVYFSFVTRVLVPEDATTEEIVETAKDKIKVKVQNELHENLEEIIDDIECPARTEEILP